MKRRDFLAGTAGAVGAAAASTLAGCDDHGASRMPQPPAAATGPNGERLLPWQNWSGYQSCLPAQRLAPASLDELVSQVKAAKGALRPVGAGHSFTPLVPTDGAIVSLRNFEGLLGYDAATLTATFGAGTRLGDVGEPLNGIGQSLANMPDIDEQSLAGAISTGTHGTGQTLGALHSYVTALQLVTPRGDVLDCSRDKNAEIFDATRISLGSLGFITQVTIRNVPARRLKRRAWLEPIDALIERFDELAAKHESFEFYYFPFCDYGAAIAIDPTDEPVNPRVAEGDNDIVTSLRRVRDFTEHLPRLRRWLLNKATSDFTPEEAVDDAHKIFPSSRPVRFNEMEYHLPREALMPTLRKVRETLETRHPEIFFPVEIRTVRGAGDTAWLSPFQGHDISGSIAVHHWFKEDPLPYFADIEALYQPLGGRPHWAKMHTLDATTFSQRYPRFTDFQKLRMQLDPEGQMLNPFLKKILGA